MTHAALLLALVCTLATTLPAHSQSYPTRPVRIVVGFPAGGATDVTARAIAQKLGEAFGQSVVVDNRPGAASNIGAEHVAKSGPDGHTLLMGSVSLSINATLYAKLPYSAQRDLAAVVQVTNTPFMLCVHPSVPARNVKELIALARSRPGQLSYASAGSGSGAHLFTELFRSMAGIDMLHVPYKGAQPALHDLLSGQIPLALDNIITMAPLARIGKLRCLAISTTRRSSIAPEIPTIAEAALQGYDANAWFGLFAPAGTPREAIERLNGEVNKALRAPDLRERLIALGCEPAGGSAEQFAGFFRAEVEKWGKVVKSAGVRVE